MAAALTPMQAIAYVRELSADVRAVAVLDAEGATLAGDAMLAADAAELVATLGPPASAGPATGPAGAGAGRPAGSAELVARAPGGVVFLARDQRHAVVAVAGPLSLVGPTALDVRAALAALRGEPGDDSATAPPRPSEPTDPAVRRAITALFANARRSDADQPTPEKPARSGF